MTWSGLLTTLSFACVYSLFALSVYAPLSAGVFSVASIPSAAVGGFLYAWASGHTALPALVILVLAAAAGGVFALIASYALLRLNSHYLAMATIALILVTGAIVLNWRSVTGGVSGMSVPESYGWPTVLGTLAFWSWVFHRLKGSRIGLAASVLREDVLVGSALGVNPLAIQRLVFVLAGVLGGMAGVLFANLLRYIEPTTFYVGVAFTALATFVLGGVYAWQGSIVGAFVYTLLPFLLQGQLSPIVTQVLTGALIIAFMVFLPGGLWDLRHRFQRKRRGEPPDSKEPSSGYVDDAVASLTTSELALAPVDGDEAKDVLVVTELSKAFGGVKAVDGVSLGVRERQIFGIVGPNGAGKTTLLNLVSGVLPSDSGSVEVLGTDATSWPPHLVSNLGMARTYQTIRIPPGMSTIDTIVSGAYSLGTSNAVSVVFASPSERRERKRLREQGLELMAALGITSPPDQIARTLPYGFQRRVEIARALASKPEILLLDEPTAGMNVSESEDLGELLEVLVATGQTIVVVEHNIGLVTRFCDTAVVMNAGKIIAEGDPAEAFARDDVQRAYFGRRVNAPGL